MVRSTLLWLLGQGCPPGRSGSRCQIWEFQTFKWEIWRRCILKSTQEKYTFLFEDQTLILTEWLVSHCSAAAGQEASHQHWFLCFPLFLNEDHSFSLFSVTQLKIQLNFNVISMKAIDFLTQPPPHPTPTGGAGGVHHPRGVGGGDHVDLAHIFPSGWCWAIYTRWNVQTLTHHSRIFHGTVSVADAIEKHKESKLECSWRCMQQFNASTRVDVHSSFTIVSSMSMLHVA